MLLLDTGKTDSCFQLSNCYAKTKDEQVMVGPIRYSRQGTSWPKPEAMKARPKMTGLPES